MSWEIITFLKMYKWFVIRPVSFHAPNHQTDSHNENNATYDRINVHINVILIPFS